jgi:uncharacterized protein YneF (UPF0154 family)
VGFIITSALTALGLGLGLWGGIELGYRYGRAELAKNPDRDLQGIGAIENTIYGLLGLILAFTFTGALGRFDMRRQLIVKEANAIGTAYLRLDLLPSSDQQKLRPLYRQYTQLRIDLYKRYDDENFFNQSLSASLNLQSQIWQISTASVLSIQNPSIISAVINATNEMIDVTNERLQESRTHPPSVVYFLLVSLTIVSGLMIGFNMSVGKRRSPYHILLFCLIIAGTVFIIIDLEYPRRGLFQIGIGDQVLQETLDGIKD